MAQVRHLNQYCSQVTLQVLLSSIISHKTSSSSNKYLQKEWNRDQPLIRRRKKKVIRNHVLVESTSPTTSLAAFTGSSSLPIGAESLILFWNRVPYHIWVADNLYSSDKSSKIKTIITQKKKQASSSNLSSREHLYELIWIYGND